MFIRGATLWLYFQWFFETNYSNTRKMNLLPFALDASHDTVINIWRLPLNVLVGVGGAGRCVFSCLF